MTRLANVTDRAAMAASRSGVAAAFFALLLGGATVLLSAALAPALARLALPATTAWRSDAPLATPRTRSDPATVAAIHPRRLATPFSAIRPAPGQPCWIGAAATAAIAALLRHLYDSQAPPAFIL